MPLFGITDIEEMKGRGDIDGLIKALGYRDEPSVPRFAAQALGDLKEAGAVDALLAVLQDASSIFKYEVAIALGKIGDLRAAGSLLKAVKDNDYYVRRAAALAYIDIILSSESREAGIPGSRSVEPCNAEVIWPLIAGLKSGDLGSRKQCVSALGRYGPLIKEAAARTRIVEELTHLQDLDYKELKQPILDALESFGGMSVTAEVRRHIIRKEWRKCIPLRKSAVEPLAQILYLSRIPSRLSAERRRFPTLERSLPCPFLVPPMFTR